MSIFNSRDYYKPFGYSWAFDYFRTHEKIHWVPQDIPLHSDVLCWNNDLTDEKKHLLTQIFRFFPQGDIDIAGGYVNYFIPVFPAPELRMMLTSFAAREGIHVEPYAMLLDTIGMPEAEYKAFLEYVVMKEKHQYIRLNPLYQRYSLAWNEGYDFNRYQTKTLVTEVLRAIVINSTFGEGLQLFGSFAILMNFPRHNQMLGMGKVIEWSIRDESLHVEAMLRLFHQILDEYPKVWNNKLKSEIYQACRDMVNLEFKFIDLAFEMGGIDNLTADDVKQYIRYLADRRLLQLGLKPEFKVKVNPLEWLDELLELDRHVNFFENVSTDYVGTLSGDFENVLKRRYGR